MLQFHFHIYQGSLLTTDDIWLLLQLYIRVNQVLMKL